MRKLLKTSEKGATMWIEEGVISIKNPDGREFMGVCHPTKITDYFNADKVSKAKSMLKDAYGIVGNWLLNTQDFEMVKKEIEIFETEKTLKKQQERDALEACMPGIHEAIRLSEKISLENEVYEEKFERMMENEMNDGVNMPKKPSTQDQERLMEILGKNYRMLVYLKAKKQSENCHWADNTGKGAAAEKCMKMIVSGSHIKDCEATLAGRREFLD